MGREFSYAPLERLWQSEERTLFEALDLALDDHIVGETEDGYAFRHPLLWEVVYHRMPGARRAILHERAALKLEALYGDDAEEHAAELANHFVSAGRVHIDRALQYLVAAGDQAERGYAHTEAEGYYRRALELAKQSGKVLKQAETLEKLGGVLKTTNHLHEALDVLEEASQTYGRVGDLEGEGRVVALMGLVHYFRRSYNEGIAQLEPVVERLEQRGPSRSLAVLYASLPRVYLPVHRYPEGLAAAERAVELARLLKDDRLIPDAMFIHGRALLESGRVEEAVPVLEESIRLGEVLPDLFVVTAGCAFASYAYLALGEVARGTAYCERSLRAAEERGGLEQMHGGLVQLTEIAFFAGEWKAAYDFAERHLTVSLARAPKPGAASHRIRGMLASHTGDWQQASAHLSAYFTLAEQTSGNMPLLRACALLAELDLLRGRSEEALARLDPLPESQDWSERVDVLIVHAWALMEMGNLTDARDSVELAISVAQRSRAINLAAQVGVYNAPLLVDAFWVKGMILGREGNTREAEESFREAVTLAKPMPYPYGEARALYEWGRMLTQEGDLEQAGPHLEEALTIFQRLGARPYVEWSEQLFLEFGARRN